MKRTIASVIGISLMGLSTALAEFSITQQPLSQMADASGDAMLSVAATGEGSLEYQWFRGNVPVDGETGATLSLSGLGCGDDAVYRCVVSAGAESVTSHLARVSRMAGAQVAWGRTVTNAPADLEDAVALSVGDYFALALKAGGTVVAWGTNGKGQSTVPAGLSHVVAVAAGGEHGLALQADGTVVAWGSNSHGQSSVPANLAQVVAITAGYYYSMALQADGTVAAWGANGSGQRNVPTGLSNVVAIAAGNAHSLALKADGTVEGWGDFDWGQRTPPPGLSNVVAIAAGSPHSVALKADGTVTAWGRSALAAVPGDLAHVVAIDAGHYHTLALQADGTVVAWGAVNDYGQYTVPPFLANAFAVAAGTYHSMALVPITPPVITEVSPDLAIHSGQHWKLEAEVTTIGSTELAWFREGDATPLSDTAEWKPGAATAAHAGHYYFVAANSAGAVTSRLVSVSIDCKPFIAPLPWRLSHAPVWDAELTLTANVWGEGPMTYTWLANGAVAHTSTSAAWTIPSFDPQHAGIYQLVVSNDFGTATSATVPIGTSSMVTAWPCSGEGHCSIPEDLSNVVAIDGGYYHTLTLQADGTVKAWGPNYYGEGSVPAGLSNVIAIASGYYHNLALKSDGTVVGWGRNNYNNQATVPAGLSNVVAIAASGEHSMALKSDGTIKMWGGVWKVPADLTNVVAIAAGGSGVCLALRADRRAVVWGASAEWAPELVDVVEMAAGYQHGLVLQVDGTVVVWGFNSHGQISVPAGLSNVKGIAGGYLHCLALQTDGTVVAWGDNTAGQLNVPDDLFATTIAAGFYHNLALSPLLPPEIIAVSPDQELRYGDSLQLSAEVLHPCEKAWFREGDSEPVAHAAVWDAGPAAQFHAGNYYLVASNELGVVTSRVVRVTVDSTPQMAAMPWHLSHAPVQGVELTLTALAAGEGPMTYTWLINGVLAHTSSSPAWTIPAFDQSDAGAYQLVVSNDYGTVTSAIVPVGVPAGIIAWGFGDNGQCEVPPEALPAVAVAGGGYFSMALKAGGTVTAWGDNDAGQCDVPENLADVIAIDAGYHHSLALQADGTVVAWGINNDGQTNVPSSLSGAVAIAAGGWHNLAVKANGTVVAWGDNSEGQRNVPTGLNNVVAVAGGGYHSLALQADGTVVMWGQTNNGQWAVPAGLNNVVALDAGHQHSLALQADGTVAAWGDNEYGQCDVPEDLADVRAIFAGYTYSAALLADGSVVAWGNNLAGQCDAPEGLTNAITLAAGGFHAMALVPFAPPVITTVSPDQELRHGDNLTLSANVFSPLPCTEEWFREGDSEPVATTAVWNAGPAAQVHAGNYCFVASNAVGASTSRVVTVTVDSAPLIATLPWRLSHAPVHGAALTLTANAWGEEPLTYTWLVNGVVTHTGSDAAWELPAFATADAGYYQLVVSNSYGGATSALLPVGLPAAVLAIGADDHGQCDVPETLNRVVAIAAGDMHSLALQADGAVVAWGDEAQLDIPSSLAAAVEIAAGVYHCLALQANGTVVAWGSNQGGQCNVPPGLDRVAAISGGAWHSLALKADGAVVAWGHNADGQCTVPDGLDNVIAVAGGTWHSLALQADGRVVGWGANQKGQSTVPAGLANVVAIAAGHQHSLALKADGTVVAWGDNGDDQCDVPEGLDNVIAIAAGDFYSLALYSDGSIALWGGIGDLEWMLHANGIAAGAFHSLISVRQTLEAPKVVPYAWLDQYYPGLDVPTYETTALGTGANGLKVWESYVAGLTPTDPGSRLFAHIEMLDGEPLITWTPDLGASRTYTIWGTADLTADPTWQTPPTTNHRFFKVTVEME